MFYSVWKEATHKPSTVAAGKKPFLQSIVIATTCLDEFFLIHLITGRYHCVKSVQMWSFFWSVFSRIRTDRFHTAFFHNIKVYRYSDFFSVAMLSLSLKLVYWTKSNTKVPKKLSYIILMGVSHYQNKMHSNNVNTIIEYFFVMWTLLKTHFRLQILVKSNDSLGALPAFTIL